MSNHSSGRQAPFESPRRGLRASVAVSGASAALLVARAVSAAPPGGLAPPTPRPEVGASGLTLMVAAYAAIWLVAFAFVLLTLRRQRSMDRRIAELGAQLDAIESSADGAHARDEQQSAPSSGR